MSQSRSCFEGVGRVKRHENGIEGVHPSIDTLQSLDVTPDLRLGNAAVRFKHTHDNPMVLT